MDFEQTTTGRQFFEGQLPSLISALQELATALAQPRQAIYTTTEVPASFLQDLYYGEFDPSALPNGPEHNALTQKIKDYQDRLSADVSPELWDRIDGYRTLLDDRGSVERVQAFEAGYRCVFQMIAAGFSPRPSKEGAQNV